MSGVDLVFPIILKLSLNPHLSYPTPTSLDEIYMIKEKYRLSRILCSLQYMDLILNRGTLSTITIRGQSLVHNINMDKSISC